MGPRGKMLVLNICDVPHTGYKMLESEVGSIQCVTEVVEVVIK